MINKRINKLVLLILCITTPLLFSCSIGPRALKSTHIEYNKAVRLSESEQLLLNLVRLKYYEPPQFITVSGILAQFSFSTALGGSIGTERGDPRRLVDGFVSYSDNPTITFTPQNDQEFYRGLLSPVSIKTIYLLLNSGWDIERVLRLTVEDINGLENARSAGGFTPEAVPSFEDFREVAKIIGEFWNNNQLTICSEEEIVEISDSISQDKVNAADIVGAANQGYEFRSFGKDGELQLIKTEKVFSLCFSKNVLNDPRKRRLDQLLKLAPARLNYKIKLAMDAESNDSIQEKRVQSLYLTTRSVLSVMRYLSEAVDIPEEHIKKGVVRVTLDESSNSFDWSQMLGDIFRINTTDNYPEEAGIAVKHKNKWFYIKNSDLDTKSTFGLLVNIFHLETSGVPGANPVLTLPAGR